VLGYSVEKIFPLAARIPEGKMAEVVISCVSDKVRSITSGDVLLLHTNHTKHKNNKH